MRFIRLRSNWRDMIRLAVMSVIVLSGGIAFAAGAAAEDADAAGVPEKMMMEVQGTAEAGDAAQAAETAAPGDTTETGEKMEADTYPLQTCVVSGAKLGSMGEPVVYEYEGREVRFCCKGCIKAFEKDPDKYIAKIDEARKVQAAEKSIEPYPLDTCLVSGANLGTMGDPVTYVHDGREVKFCCGNCLSQFKKNPEKYMEKLHTVGSDPADESDEP